MKLNKGSYEKFLNYLESISHLCESVEIKDSKLCQYTNGKTGIISADFNSIFPESILLRLVMLKIKLPILSIFTKSETEEINMDIDEKNLKISDEYSHVNMRLASSEFISYGYIDETTMNNKINLDFQNDSLFDIQIPQMIVKRIDSISTYFQSMYLMINIENGKASFNLTSYSKTDNSSVLKNIDVNSSDNIQVMFSVYPFQTKFDGDLKVNLAISKPQNSKQQVAIMKIDSTIKDIPTSFYLRGTVLK